MSHDLDLTCTRCRGIEPVRVGRGDNQHDRAAARAAVGDAALLVALSETARWEDPESEDVMGCGTRLARFIVVHAPCDSFALECENGKSCCPLERVRIPKEATT